MARRAGAGGGFLEWRSARLGWGERSRGGGSRRERGRRGCRGRRMWLRDWRLGFDGFCEGFLPRSGFGGRKIG